MLWVECKSKRAYYNLAGKRGLLLCLSKDKYDKTLLSRSAAHVRQRHIYIISPD